ncbi:hypothetical protein ABBQ38_004798 [Trebouxia sp. C0009 RCD-2024]
MLPTTYDTQLQAVQQDIADVKAELHQVKQDLTKARADNDAPEVEFLRRRVEAMDKQLSSLRDKDNMLLRDQLEGSARDINHAAAAASLSPEPKRQRQGRHPAGTPPRSTSGVQTRACIVAYGMCDDCMMAIPGPASFQHPSKRTPSCGRV